ncbi:hypothetical protein [Ruficoccus sp. ZRK36]|uniref:hypothetical protein n=1 Tax=Ruficoccus sp. ZRK36 TaxID=2866311 RepID=UPI001C72C270|nr:hypothetical protein [Ruficoccus sp. ZRK36]QYY37462.1 hypothetical protein K0V07_08230 [Ruficoccus sp. ZRK36]
MAYRSFWPKQDTVAQFVELGVDTVCIYPSNTLNSLGVEYSQHRPNWMHFGVYKWEYLDRQFDEILEVNPSTQFLCMIDLNTPNWLTRFSRYDDSFYNLGKVAGDTRWRKEATEYLHAFLEHCEQKYGEHIKSYILCAGATCEWQDASHGQESPSRIDAWRQWCAEQGNEDSTDLPSMRERTSAAHGLLKDPQADGLSIRYWDFSRNLIADTILYFAEQAQSIIDHRVDLGVFYGYVLEHGHERLVSYGHLGYDKVFASDDIDFFISPGTYADREMGGASGYMSLIDSMKLHGKGYIREIDHFTHTANGNPLLPWGIPWGESWNHRWSDEPSSIAGLRREFSLALTKGVSLWWFDMWNHWYDSKNVLQALEQMKDIWDEQVETPAADASEIAVLVDADSCLALNEYDKRVIDVFRTLRQPLGRIGAPYSLYSTADIDRIDFTQFKLVIFPNLFACDTDKAEELKNKIAAQGRTLLWIHMAGVIADGHYDEANVEKLTGLPYKPGSIQEKDFGGWTSVLHSDLSPSAASLRAIADSAGVHLYGAVGEPVYANSRLLAAHTATGGLRTFQLPAKCSSVRELFSGRVVATDCDSFEDTLQAPDSVLYQLEYDNTRV